MNPPSDKHGVSGPFWDDLKGKIQIPPFQSGDRAAATWAGAALHLSVARLSAAAWELWVVQFCFQTDLGGEGFTILWEIRGGLLVFFVVFFFLPESRGQGLAFPGDEVLSSTARPGHGRGCRRGLKPLFTQNLN